eukprot:1157656-Pelagomonas_calceolata.AAC.8
MTALLAAERGAVERAAVKREGDKKFKSLYRDISHSHKGNPAQGVPKVCLEEKRKEEHVRQYRQLTPSKLYPFKLNQVSCRLADLANVAQKVKSFVGVSRIRPSGAPGQSHLTRTFAF